VITCVIISHRIVYITTQKILSQIQDKGLEEQMVCLPGGHHSSLGVGLHQGLVGSILDDKRLYTTSIDKRCKSVATKTEKSWEHSEKVAICFSEGLLMLCQTSPASLKSLCRKTIRRLMLRGRVRGEAILLKKLLPRPDLTSFLLYASL